MTVVAGTETGVSTTGSKKKTLTTFSAIPNHLKTEVLPESNKESRFLVVDKDKDKTPSGASSIGEAYELKFMQDKVQSCFPSSFIFLQSCTSVSHVSHYPLVRC